MIVRRTFYWVSKVIRNFLSIVLPPTVASPANSGHFSNRSDSKLKNQPWLIGPILDSIGLHFSRAPGDWLVFTLILVMIIFFWCQYLLWCLWFLVYDARSREFLVGIMLPAPRILFQSFGGELKDASYWFHAGKTLDKPFVISYSNF